MSAIYNRFYKMALKRLSTGANGVGIPIKITRGGDPTIDVTTGEVVSVESIINTSGIKMAIKQYLIDNDLILNSDVNFYISPEDDDGVAIPMLDPTDLIEFSGVTYVIIDSKPWDFNGVLIGQKVHARLSS